MSNRLWEPALCSLEWEAQDTGAVVSASEDPGTGPGTTQSRAAQHSPTSSHQSKAVQPWSSWTFLPLYKEDMGVKSVVTALTSYRIHGFSIAWRIWTLRRWKPTSGTASKVHVWSTRTGSSQTPAWVKHSTYMPNTTGFIVRRELRKQSCFVSTTKQQEHLLGEASRYTHA